MKTVLFLSVMSLLLFSCTNEEDIYKNDQQKILDLKEKYQLTEAEKTDIDLNYLQSTSIDSLADFLKQFQQLKGIKIPIRMQAEESNKLQIALDFERINKLRIKTRSETVLVSEMLFVSLATLRMNVWLDISIPSVVTSELTGLTVFDRWEQKSADASKNGDIINFSVFGVWYYKIVIDGIGDFFSYDASFSGSFNTKTGEGDLYVL